MDWLWLLAKFFVFTYLSEVFGPKNQQKNPDEITLKDISFPTVDPTRPHQWLIGKRLIDNANLFGTYDLVQIQRSKRVRTGIFTHGSQPLSNGLFISAGMILCGGAGVRLKEIWIEDVVVWTGDIGDGGTVSLDHQISDNGQEDNPSGFSGVVEFHSGSATPSAYLESKRGAGNTPAWSHLTYVVLRGPAPGTDASTGQAHTDACATAAWIGTNPTVKLMKFVCERMPTAVSTGLGAPSDGGDYWVVDTDANPAYAEAEILVDRFYGAGIDPAELNKESFHAGAKQYKLENHGTSQLWDSQRTAGAVVVEICKQTGSIIQPDPNTGLQNLRLLRATDDVVFTLDDDNIERLTSFSRAAMDEAVNAMSLQYTARDEKWVQRPCEVQDLAAIEVAGQVISATGAYTGITNATLAGVLALRDLRAVSAPLASAQLTAIVPQSQKFLPGDAVLFSSTKNGVTSMRMRVISARYSAPGSAACELDLIEDVFMSGAAVYGNIVPTTGGTTATPPDKVDWASYWECAQYPLLDTPSELHTLYLAGAPLAHPERASGYKLAYFDAATARTTSNASWADGTIRFAARGTPTSALGQYSAGAFTMDVRAGDAYTIGQNSGAVVLAMLALGPGVPLEFLKVSATVSGSTATVAVLERGLLGTMPIDSISSGGAYPTFYLLYGYDIDPNPLPTVPSASYGNPYRDVSSDCYTVAQTTGPGGKGPWYPTWSGGGTGSASTQKIAAGVVLKPPMFPYGPGAVALGGTLLPTTSSSPPWTAIASFPAVTGTTFTWMGRNSPAQSGEGYQNGSGWEPGTTVSSRVAYGNSGGGGGWIAGDPATPSTDYSISFSTAGIAPGEYLFVVSITVTSPTRGSLTTHFAGRKTIT